MNSDSIERAVTDLSRRLARVEACLGLEHREDKPAEEPARLEATAPTTVTPPEGHQAPRATCEHAHPPATVRPDVAETAIPSACLPATASRESMAPDREHVTREVAGDVVSPKRCSDTRSWEMLIGMNWMAWAGAATVVLAAAFFVMLAYEQGWFGRLSDLTKCLVAAAFGGALLAAGEVARRRVGRVTAASLFGAGIATLYVTAYATFKWFNLADETGAFWLLMGVALLGFAITVHARLITTGVLATLGGYLTPILLSGVESFPGALALYMTMLLTVALALSAWQPQPVRLLRYVALSCHALVGALWAFHQAPGEWQLALLFLGIWWLLVNGEGLIAALRGQSPLGNPIASLFVTAWVAGIGHWLLEEVQPGGRDWLGLFAVSLAGLAALPAAAFGPGIKVLQHRPRRALEKLTVSLWAQTGILLATAIGFQFDDFGQTIGWLVLGYACVEVGRRLPSRGVDGFGLVVGALALWRVAALDSNLTVLARPCWQFADLHVTYWGLLALGAVSATFLSALRLQVHGSPPRKHLPIVLMSLGTFGWVVVCALQCRELAISAGWLAAAFVLIACERWGRRQRCFELGRIVLGLTAVKWLLHDVPLTRLARGWDPLATPALANEIFALALAITAGFAAIAFVRYRRSQADADRKRRLFRWEYSAIAGSLFLLVALSFQLEHAIARFEANGWQPTWSFAHLRALWLTPLWALGGLMLIQVGRAHRWTRIHHAGWSLLVLAAAAWLSIDTLIPRLDQGVTVSIIVLNLQFMVGVLVVGVLALAVWQLRTREGIEFPSNAVARQTTTVAYTLMLIIGLGLGTFEIDRFFAPEAGRIANAAMARQTAWSIFWGVYAIGLVALGFAKRAAWSRYAGLALLTVTLGKVVGIDMAEVRAAYRVLSFLGVGLLLMLTSVAYAKLSRELLTEGSGGVPDGQLADAEPTQATAG